MEWGWILLITIGSLFTFAGICDIIVYIKWYCRYKHMCYKSQEIAQVVNHELTKISSNIDHNVITKKDLLYYEDDMNDIQDTLILYEYKIENTYFPKDIENIIKEYIHYRLIRGFDRSLNAFVLSYPRGIIYKGKSNKSWLNANNIYTEYHPNNVRQPYTYNKYKLTVDGGFEINSDNNLLDIKVQ